MSHREGPRSASTDIRNHRWSSSIRPTKTFLWPGPRTLVYSSAPTAAHSGNWSRTRSRRALPGGRTFRGRTSRTSNVRPPGSARRDRVRDQLPLCAAVGADEYTSVLGPGHKNVLVGRIELDQRWLRISVEADRGPSR